MSFVTDTSAIISILKQEEDPRTFATMLALDVPNLISAGTLLECGILVGRELGAKALANMHVLLKGVSIETVPLDSSQIEVGLSRYLPYG